MQISRFDPVERDRQKAAARRADDADLGSGRVSKLAKRQGNSAFGHIDFSKGRIVLGDVDPVL